MNDCYENHHLYPSALRSVINLIPKRNLDSRKIANLRPISLLCTDYKLLEKVLANRLRPVLESLINQDQKGFMSSRRINCNIRYILDIIEFTEKNDIPCIIISIDFEKCFDRIEISALLASLRYFNVGDSYVRWIEMLFTDPVACVANNGNFSPYLSVTRSVKQGGPNSAYLFLVIAEVLPIAMCDNKGITSLMINEIMKILGQYADDIDLYL